jgi:hypothetical protein
MSLINKLFGKKNDQPTPVPAEERTASRQASTDEVDVNKPLENPRLKRLFEQWRQQRTDHLLNQVFEEIVTRAHFLSVIMLSEEPKPSDDGTATFKQNAIMQFPMLTTQDGKSFYPAFTDWGELKKWQSITSPPKTLILSFDNYAAMVLQKEGAEGVVINPFGDNFLMNYQTLTHLKTQKDLNTKGVSQQVVTKETKVLLGEPKEYPTAMVTAISGYLKQQPKVRRAWLRLMIRDNEQSYLLVVDFSGDKDVLFGAIAGAARPCLSGMYIDMVPYQDSFGKDAAEGVKPFYESK